MGYLVPLMKQILQQQRCNLQNFVKASEEQLFERAQMGDHLRRYPEAF